LIATARSSRESATSLRELREALQRELAEARHTIENARAAQAGVDARMLFAAAHPCTAEQSR